MSLLAELLSTTTTLERKREWATITATDWASNCTNTIANEPESKRYDFMPRAPELICEDRWRRFVVRMEFGWKVL